MRVPGFKATLLRAGVALLALSLVGGGVADAASKKKTARSKPAATRVTKTAAPARAAMSGWQTGYSDIVVDANTGRVLQETNADALRHPASITKVMTLYLLFEQLQAGKLRLNSQLPVSAYAAGQSPTKLGLRPGSTLSVEEAIQGIVTRSANDASVVIAEAISGDARSFAALMTRRARQIGMSRTTFRNPNGLPDPQQVTTARDLAVLGRAIQERFPRYYAYFSTRSFNFRGQVIPNHNRMFGRLEGVDGIKTGYTNASGFNLLTSVKNEGRYVIAVVLGGSSGGWRDNRMQQIVTANWNKAFAGRQMVARMNYAPPGGDDATSIALANASAPLPEPSPAPSVVPVPLSNPRLAMASALGGTNDEVDEDTAEGAVENDPVVTGAVAPRASAAQMAVAPLPAPVQSVAPVQAAAPTPAPQRIAMVAPAAPVPAPAARQPAPAPLPPVTVGSTDPIAPTTVKTVSVNPTSAPVAKLGNQPGILGTLAFSQPGGTATARAANAAIPAPTKGARPVQLASVGPTELPMSAAPAEVARPKSGWAIQIGAFGSEADARAQLGKARAKGGAALAKADPYTEAAGAIVRARFAGFSQQADAQRACKALKGTFGCMIFRN